MNIEKKKYKKPELETVNFEDEDIITCSGTVDDGGNGDGGEEETPPIILPVIPFF